MSIVTMAPAASEPVSLAEAKLFLRVDHDAEDELIATLIGAAREAVETHAGRALITRSVRETFDDWRRDSEGGAILSLGPVETVEAVRLLASTGEPSALPSSTYRLEGARDRPRLVFDSGAPAPPRALGGVEVDYTAGYGGQASDVPVALRLAVLHIIAALYEARIGETGLPDAARALMRPFAPARL